MYVLGYFTPRKFAGLFVFLVSYRMIPGMSGTAGCFSSLARICFGRVRELSACFCLSIGGAGGLNPGNQSFVLHLCFFLLRYDDTVVTFFL